MNPVDDYLAKLPAAERVELTRVRTIILDTLPDAVELISYGMPGFKYKGKYLAGYAAFKDHLSFFPTGEPVEAFKDKLSGYKLSKGTIQFSTDKPLPAELIQGLIRHRAASIA